MEPRKAGHTQYGIKAFQRYTSDDSRGTGGAQDTRSSRTPVEQVPGTGHCRSSRRSWCYLIQASNGQPIATLSTEKPSPRVGDGLDHSQDAGNRWVSERGFMMGRLRNDPGATISLQLRRSAGLCRGLARLISPSQKTPRRGRPGLALEATRSQARPVTLPPPPALSATLSLPLMEDCVADFSDLIPDHIQSLQS